MRSGPSTAGSRRRSTRGPGTAARSRKRPAVRGSEAGLGARPTAGARGSRPCRASSPRLAPHGPVQAAGGELPVRRAPAEVGRTRLRCCWPRPATRRGRGRSRGRCCIRTTIPASTTCSASRTWPSWPAGELLVILRTDNGAAGIHSCRSSDGGRTWSPPEPTGMIGFDQPGHLIRLGGRPPALYLRAPQHTLRPARLPVRGRGPAPGGWTPRSSCATTAPTRTWATRRAPSCPPASCSPSTTRWTAPARR